MFRWPDLGERFDWAVDWFDNVARRQDRGALVLVQEDGTSTTVSYEQMRRRSNQDATWPREQGVVRGDPVVLMLGNQVELWETGAFLWFFSASATRDLARPHRTWTAST